MGVRRHSGEQIVVARDLTHVLAVRETMINALVGGGLFCLLVSIVSGLLLNLRQMRLVRDIRNVTLRIAEGDLNRRLPIGGRDELDMLAHLVNHMLEEVERLMTEVKTACDGIAHDLRTPLTHVCGLLARIEEHAGPRGDGRAASAVPRHASHFGNRVDETAGWIRRSPARRACAGGG